MGCVWVFVGGIPLALLRERRGMTELGNHEGCPYPSRLLAALGMT